MYNHKVSRIVPGVHEYSCTPDSTYTIKAICKMNLSLVLCVLLLSIDKGQCNHLNSELLNKD